MYCKKCGGKLESYANNCAFCGEPVDRYDTTARYKEEEKPALESNMSVAKWIGFYALNLIPLVGSIIYLVLLFKWAFGDTKDLTLKNYAKANLLIMLIFIILAVIVVILQQYILLEFLEDLY